MERKESIYSFIENEIMRREENGEVVFDAHEIADTVPMALVDEEKALEWYLKKMVRDALVKNGWRSIGGGIYEPTETCDEGGIWKMRESQTQRAKGHTMSAVELMEMTEHRR